MNRFVISVVALSTFGPYVFGPVRTEQLVVYGLLSVLLPAAFFRFRPSPPVLAMVATWGCLALVGAASAISPPRPPPGYELGSPLATLDAVLMPIAAILLTQLLVTSRRRDAMLSWFTLIVPVGVALNGLIALGQMRGIVPADLLASWWSRDTTDDQVTAARALALGRYTGLFGQPALAGFAYSLGLMCAAYRFRHRPLVAAAIAALICLGGALAVSKAFVLVGLPVAGWHLLKMQGRRGSRSIALLLFAVLAVIASGGLLRDWHGGGGLSSLVSSDGQRSLLQTWTGGRYGEESAVGSVTEAVLSNQPLAGYGFHGLATPTDAEWVHLLTIGGLVGVALYLVVAATLLSTCRPWVNPTRSPEERLLLGVVTIAVATSLGFPAFTGNRVAVTLWVLVALLLARRDVGNGQSETGVAGFVQPTLPVPRR